MTIQSLLSRYLWTIWQTIHKWYLFHDVGSARDVDLRRRYRKPFAAKKVLMQTLFGCPYTPMVKVQLTTKQGPMKMGPSMQFKTVRRDGKVLCDCYNSDVIQTSGEEAVDLETMFRKVWLR